MVSYCLDIISKRFALYETHAVRESGGFLRGGILVITCKKNRIDTNTNLIYIYMYIRALE